MESIMKRTIRKLARWLRLAGFCCLAASAVWPTVTQAAADNGHVTATSVLDAKESQQPAVTETKAAQEIAAEVKADTGAAQTAEVRSVSLTWPVVPGAVKYQVEILRSAEDNLANVIMTQNQIFTNGVDIDLSRYGKAAAAFYWKVRPLDYSGNALAAYSAPQPVAAGRLNPVAPQPTAEYDQMDYAAEYPVYSWIPTPGAKHHEVQVYREVNGKDMYVKTLQGCEYDVYDWDAYTTPGRYYWRVRSVDENGTPVSEWSDKSGFSVTTPTPIAALGDSITHGGGVMSVPPSYKLYNWETYAGVPVKNLGVSGNTTQDMLDRFEHDVLPFSPRVLVIMGGVNDYRAGTLGWTVVQHLKALKEKCAAYGIIPVFVTPTPINPGLMIHRAGIEHPTPDWLVHQQYVCDWVKRQPYSVDVASPLADERGWLRSDYTTDGLHPDYLAKKEMGEKIGRYLSATFPWLLNS